MYVQHISHIDLWGTAALSHAVIKRYGPCLQRTADDDSGQLCPIHTSALTSSCNDRVLDLLSRVCAGFDSRSGRYQVSLVITTTDK